MNFMLVYEWIDENTGYRYEEEVSFFDTKEELFAAKKWAEEDFKWQIKVGRLILHAGVRYDWDEIRDYF